MLLLLAGAAVWYFFLRPAPPPPPEKLLTSHSSLITSHTPAPARTNRAAKAEAPKPKKPVDPREDYDHDRCFRDAKGILRLKSNPDIRVFDPTRKAHKPYNPNSRIKSPFAFESEREISVLLQITPGERRLTSPNYYDPCFLEDFEASLKKPIEVKDTDAPYEADVKRAVAEAKEELVKRMAAGEKLADILTETKEELERLVTYKEDLKGQLNRYVKGGDGNLSPVDVADYVRAANQMLESKGISPVSIDEFVSWNVQLAAKKAGLDEAAEKRLEEADFRAAGLKSPDSSSADENSLESPSTQNKEQ